MHTRMRELLFCSFFGKWYTGEYFLVSLCILRV